MADVRGAIGRISDIAAAVAQSSDQQVGADPGDRRKRQFRRARRGAAGRQRRTSSTAAVADANTATDKVATQSRQVSTLFGRLTKRLTVTLKNFADADRASSRARPRRFRRRWSTRGQTVSSEVWKFRRASALIGGCRRRARSGRSVDLDLRDIGPLRAPAWPRPISATA